MTQPKLILIEGIPGSGKTTTAHFVAEWLRQRGVETALFLEGNLDHPADFESVACLDEREVVALKATFPAHAPLLESQATVLDGDHFFHYRRMEESCPLCPPALIAALARYEIYELPVSKWRRLVQQRWQQFAASAAAGTITYVFECCFLQNPLTMLLGRNDEAVTAAQAFVLDLASAVQPLAPRLIYLCPGDVRHTLTTVAQQRPPAWLEFVIAYHTQQGHGLVQNWQGFEGLVNFYEMRQSVELALLPRLPFPTLLVEQTTWAHDQPRIADFLAETIPSPTNGL